MDNVKILPSRTAVNPADCWDLASLYNNDASWEKAFKTWEEQIPGYEKFRGKLGQSSEMLSACLQFDTSIERTADRLVVRGMHAPGPAILGEDAYHSLELSFHLRGHVGTCLPKIFKVGC